MSVDLPFALNEFRDQVGLSVHIISDAEKERIDASDDETNIGDIEVENVSKRTESVIDEAGTVTYTWVSDGPASNPTTPSTQRQPPQPNEQHRNDASRLSPRVFHRRTPLTVTV